MQYKISIADIHLGHPKNPAGRIKNNLEIWLKKIKVDISHLYIVGDLVDRELSMSSQAALSFLETLVVIRNFCILKKCKLRILKGTPSHDREQLNLIGVLMEKIDYRYISDIEIEEDDGFNVLYVPDEIRPSAKIIMEDIKKELHKNNIKKVNLCLLHGQFHHQLPEVVNSVRTHEENEFLNIVTDYVLMGHPHKHTNYEDTIITCSSFDRLRHGEEDPKGGLIFKLGKNKTCEHIPNENSLLFITIDVSDKETKDIIPYLEQNYSNTEPGSHIKLITKDTSIFKSIIHELKTRYSLYNWTCKPLKKKKKIEHISMNGQFSGISINKKTLKNIIMEKISPINRNYIDPILNRIIGEQK